MKVSRAPLIWQMQERFRQLFWGIAGLASSILKLFGDTLSSKEGEAEKQLEGTSGQLLANELGAFLARTGCPLPPKILFDGGPDQREYDERRRIFNTKFDFRPKAIVLVENDAQVSGLVKFANANASRIRLRVRGGGHDHEGECSGTDAIVIDFMKMANIEIPPASATATDVAVTIGAGARFMDIKGPLDCHGLSIPHGTCSTVGVVGYTLGGGWGPWTRKYGMGCERLIGATLVLADGTIVELSDQDPPDSPKGRLLWALRGGGGMSYGIVTRLKFLAFRLPPAECRQSFQVLLKGMETVEVFQRWEAAIRGNNYPDLVGTSLRIAAVNRNSCVQPDDRAVLPAKLLGFYLGSENDVRTFVARAFGDTYASEVQFEDDTRDCAFEHWDGREHPLLGGAQRPNAIVLERGLPAPHKITSRVVDEHGWDDNGRIAVVRSLQSPLVQDPPRTSAKVYSGMNTYITVLAIDGPFYANPDRDRNRCAFPYPARPFIVQYQAWWNQFADPKDEFTDQGRETILENRQYTNRAEDWIQHCRDYPIPGTSGAFISFKDDAVPTADYFVGVYEELRRVKAKYSRDENLILQTRKTII